MPCSDIKNLKTGSIQMLGGWHPCFTSGSSGCSKMAKPLHVHWMMINSIINRSSWLATSAWQTSRILIVRSPQISSCSECPDRIGFGPSPVRWNRKRATDQLSQGGPARTAYTAPCAAMSNQWSCAFRSNRSPSVAWSTKSTDAT